jgi:hypothetical protein
MTRGPEVLTFGATAGCVVLVTSAALALIIWAAFTFVETTMLWLSRGA